MSEVPQHLKSKAANVDAVSRAARILAITMFTVFERSVCTISGTTAKNGSPPQPGKEPKQKFDEHRLTLIQDFLRRIYPKSYSASTVNRNIGQVAIETRGGRHRQNDEIVLSILTSADSGNI